MLQTKTTLSRAQLLLAGAAALSLVVAIALLHPPISQAALQKMAGYEKGDATTFASVSSYLNNVRDGLMPLAIPAGSIGLVAGGVMHFVGHQMASKLLLGVLIGMGLVLGAPSIIA